MSKGGTTKKLEDTVKALDAKQLKKALYLTDREKLERQHAWVEEAARTCLVDKTNKEACEKAMKEARGKIQDTISLPIEDTSLEGLEEYLSPESKPTEAKPEAEEQKPPSEMTDEELYQNCEDCHVAVAASEFARLCEEHPGETGQACRLISEKVADETTEPVDWIKTMIQATEQVEGEPKQKMAAALTELVEYLEERDSPWLKELEEGEE